MTTPPPSHTTSSSTPPPTDAPVAPGPDSGVTPPDGYTTDTGQMGTAGRNISNAAEDANGEVDDLQPTKLTEAEFGKKHTQWQADYAAGIEEIGTGAVAMCTNLTSFAGQLSGAGQAYGATEQDAASTVSAPGSGQ